MNQKWDVLIVLGAVMRPSVDGVGWTFPLVMNADEYSGRLVLGEWRACAAVELSEQAELVLVTGGNNKHPKTGQLHSRAVELARRIVELGAKRDKVIPIGQLASSHVLGNISNYMEFLSQRPEMKRIAILSPRFQMERAKLMHSNDPRSAGFAVEWVEVEKVLVEAEIIRESEVQAIYNSPEGQICAQMEREGIAHFKSGTYKPKQ